MTLVVERFVERTHIAYFSREIALRPEIQTYSGGPGVLRGRLTSGGSKPVWKASPDGQR
jgi:hypothetical protein